MFYTYGASKQKTPYKYMCICGHIEGVWLSIYWNASTYPPKYQYVIRFSDICLVKRPVFECIN